MSTVLIHSADNRLAASQAYNAPTVSSSPRAGAIVPVLAGIAACVIGALVLMGWFFDIRFLRQPVVSAAAMMANSALAFILCGASLWLRYRRPASRAATALALLAAIVGAATFAEYVFGWNLGFDRWLIANPPQVGLHPGRMSWLTALCLLLLGCALVSSERRIWLSHTAALVALFGSTVVTVGYLYDIRELVGIGAYTTTAPHTAALLVLLALGVLLLRPHEGVMAPLSSDTLGGRMARRTLPATIAVPIVLGWLRLEGERAELYPAHLGPPLVVFGTMVLLSIVLWLNARRLDDADARRLDAEDEMRRANETLEDRVAMKTAEALQNQTRAAEAAERLRAGQRMEAMGRLAGGVAHDFNNTMTVITGYTELLLARTPREEPTYKPLEEIRKAGVRCSALTRHLLAFSRRQVLTPSLTDLNIVVADLGEMLPMLIGEDVEVVIERGKDLWPVRADATQLEQVIVNLVVNARDAMPEGGRVTIRTRNVDVTSSNAGAHSELAAGSYVELTVADSGRGMDEETRARAFDPFFTTKPVGQGTGLGLSTAYGVITQSDGSIYLDSAPGRGTTVRIYLPRAVGTVTAAPPVINEQIERGAETVLLVEDEDGLRQLLQTVLEGAGYRVLEAANGRQALEVSGAHQGPIDILVSDVVMPGMSGRELVERLLPLRPEARVLLISGYTHTAGFEHPIDDSAAPIRNDDGDISGSVLIFRDVTARRRLEADRAQQLLTARLLASIVETSDDAIISKSLDGVLQSWNAAAVRLFGYTADEAVGRHISLIIPPERLAEEEHIIATMKAGRRIEHFETERIRADGRLVSVSLTVSPIKDDAGNVVGASKIARDITDRKRAEAEREKFIAELADADRRKNEFLAMLAHELRTPLAPISNAVRALRVGGAKGESEQAAYSMLERQTGQMARLVDDLLDISRITRGRIELRTALVELAPIVQQAVEAARTLYAGLHHQLTVSIPDHPVFLNADRVRLAQVIGNLLNNAAKFTNRGGQVWLTVTDIGQEVVISVRDNGIGIAPDKLPRIFDMFTQLDTTLERSRDGLGIGLTLVKTLVEMQSGSVDARSAGPGLGSEFIVRLPIVVDASSHEPAPRVEELLRGDGQRVLIVDDSEDGAESLSLLLQVNGYETHKAYDGIEAVEATERLQPDAILLDIGLPRLNGYDACRRIREQPWGAGILLIALTGWGMDEDRNRSRDAGFDSHLVKPVDVEVLLRLLGRLDRTETRR